MASDEPVLHAKNPEVQSHVRSYVAFIKLMKWGAIVSFIIGYIVMLIISD